MIDHLGIQRLIQPDGFLQGVELQECLIAQAHEQRPFALLIFHSLIGSFFRQEKQMDRRQRGFLAGLMGKMFPCLIGR